MARLDPVCEALAERARDFTEYPVLAEDPTAVNIQGPTGVVHAVSGTVTLQGGSEQQWLDSLRLDFYCSLGLVTPKVIKALRALVEPVADAFAPTASTTTYYRLGGLVNRCALVGYEFGNVDRQGAEFYVARFSFDVKRTRFAGDA